MKAEKYFICIDGDRYAFDLDKIRDYCLKSDLERSKEQEIVENWDYDQDSENDSPGMIITSKINRELKTTGNPQNDTIIYDLVKLFLNVILSTDEPLNMKSSDMSLSFAMAFNTLVAAEMIYKI